MEAFGSFCVDHKKLDKGIYLARVDEVGFGSIYTLDVRMRRPYVDEPLTEIEAHSLEHIIASRIEEQLKDNDFSKFKKIYVGPMGCMTGFYIVLYVPHHYAGDISTMCARIISKACTPVESVPFNSEDECGNCRTLAVCPKDIHKVNQDLDFMNRMCLDVIIGEKFNEYPYL